ncbi:MAG: HNH endonuclease [Flavobacteriales bacterium]|nr:HNH endonuclease [Flavobacteriales bacterium]
MPNIFPVPFALANEVVKRQRLDNRRLVELPLDGGNNLFYLGSPDRFLGLFDNDVRTRLQELQQLCLERRNNPPNNRTLQRGEGIRTVHLIRKSELESLIPFVDSYLSGYGDQYHNPRFDRDRVSNALNDVDGQDLAFYSDLTFIRDTTQVKPYFKWFNYPESEEFFKLTQEFFIPHLSFLNFEIINASLDSVTVRWHLSYAEFVINCSDNIDAVVTNSLRTIPVSDEERETIKEAIVKVRIGQSQFRQTLLDKPDRSCLFTGVSEEALLVASHIKPWSVAESRERLDTNNGVLLTPTFDKLFDRFLLSVDEDGNVVWSQNRLNSETVNKLLRGIEEPNHLKFNITEDNRSYFDYHRQRFAHLENSLMT